MIIFQTIKNFRLTLLLSSLLFAILTFLISHLTFIPHQIGTFDFTVTFQTQDQCNPNWTLNTVQKWLTGAFFDNQIPVDFQVKKTGWQTLQIQIENQSETEIQIQTKLIFDLLKQEARDFNSQNPDSIHFSNQHLTVYPAQNHPFIFAIFGLIFGFFASLIFLLLRASD